MLKHLGAYTGFEVYCPILAAQKPAVIIMYQQWLLLGLLTQGMQRLAILHGEGVALSNPHGEGVALSIPDRQKMALSIPDEEGVALSISHGGGVALFIPHRIVCTKYIQ